LRFFALAVRGAYAGGIDGDAIGSRCAGGKFLSRRTFGAGRGRLRRVRRFRAVREGLYKGWRRSLHFWGVWEGFGGDRRRHIGEQRRSFRTVEGLCMCPVE